MDLAGTMGRIATIAAGISGLVVGLTMMFHYNGELFLAVSVITGNLGMLLGWHGHHDPNHVAVHKDIEGH